MHCHRNHMFMQLLSRSGNRVFILMMLLLIPFACDAFALGGDVSSAYVRIPIKEIPIALQSFVETSGPSHIIAERMEQPAPHSRLVITRLIDVECMTNSCISDLQCFSDNNKLVGEVLIATEKYLYAEVKFIHLTSRPENNVVASAQIRTHSKSVSFICSPEFLTVTP